MPAEALETGRDTPTTWGVRWWQTREEMAAMRECVIFDLDGTFAFWATAVRMTPAAPSMTKSTKRSISSTRRSGGEARDSRAPGIGA